MQGWRISQEDAHNCILGLSDEAKLALFAVYDGHGGAEVAQYTAQHFPQHILKEKLASSKTNFSEILVDAFLSFDLHLKQAHVLHKLREMASGGGKPKDKDADPKEARMLQKEASMPLEQILAKYVHQRANKLLKERRRGDGEEVSDEEDDEEEEDDDDDDEEEDEDDDDDEEDEEDEDEDDEDEDDEEGEEEGADKEENGEKIQNGKQNGVVVNGNHASDEAEAAAEKEGDDEDEDEKPRKKPRLEMEEFGMKGASKGGKGGKGKKTLLPRVPIEASPAIQAKTESKAPKTESKLAKADPIPLSMKMDLEQQLLNGHSENENNENKEREQTRINGENRNAETNADASETNADANSTSSDTTTTAPETTAVKNENDVEKSDESTKSEENEDKPAVDITETEAASSTTTNGTSEKEKASTENGSSSIDKKEASKPEEDGANAENAAAGSSSSSSSASGAATSSGSRRSRKAQPVRHVKLLEMNTEDDSDESEDDLEKKMIKDLSQPESDDSEDGDDDGDDDEDDDEEGDDDDEDDDENGEDDEADDENDEDYEDIQSSGEEPGFDSGCTACVSLMVGNELFVANVGDSRCVVSRGGEAIEMSFDHKPTDEIETNRITKAGGKVTEDGRVNGGLNLSRALGDHSYKTVSSLPDREQMISALPDIKSMVLTDKDEFMVIACDGIWNSMTSQEVIDFVKMRIDHEKELTLTQICEELFDHCLAPHTMGDGTGCDNMTCIIVRFDSLSAMSAKRTIDESENPEANRSGSSSEEPSGKRQKLEGGSEVSAQ